MSGGGREGAEDRGGVVSAVRWPQCKAAPAKSETGGANRGGAWGPDQRRSCKRERQPPRNRKEGCDYDCI